MQRRVELAVLHQVDGFGERQILDLAEVLVGHAGGGKDRARIELGAGFRRADREALALEVGQRLDAALGGGDDLDVVRIDRADGAQLVELGLEAGLLVAVPGRLQRVAEREGDLAAALLQQIRFSTDALVAWTWVFTFGILSLKIFPMATPSG